MACGKKKMRTLLFSPQPLTSLWWAISKLYNCALSLFIQVLTSLLFKSNMCSVQFHFILVNKTLPKAKRTRGLTSYHKITVHKSWIYYDFRISIEHSLQNLNQTSASRLNLKLKSWPNLVAEYLPRFNFVTSTKHQQQNTDQSSASKSRLNFNFKILTKLLKVWTKVKLYDQTSASKSATDCFTILIANISKSNKFWVGIFTHQGHINQVY